MKKIFFLFVVLVLFCNLGFVIAFSGSGSGTSAFPFQIGNCTQVQEMEDNLTVYYQLTQNISCSDTVNWEIGRAHV